MDGEGERPSEELLLRGHPRSRRVGARAGREDGDFNQKKAPSETPGGIGSSTGGAVQGAALELLNDDPQLCGRA